LPGNETRHFKLAGSTPCGPKIKQYNLAAISAQIQFPMMQIGAHELRRFFVKQ
jgi:hypothetical protein